MTTTTASLMINGRKQFFSANGQPLAGGFVYYYVPGTTTFKTTWKEAGEANANTNPIILDAAGTALVYGSGSYREYVTDSLGNLIQDALTSGQTTSAAANYVYSVTTYGATGNGITDDTAACQAAINAAILTGGTVFFPHGKYLITGSGLAVNRSSLSSLTDLTRINLLGEGQGNSAIYYTGTGVALTYTGSTGGSGAGATGLFTIEKLQITGNSNATQIGLSITLAAYWAMRDCTIDFFNVGLNMVDTLSCLIERVTIIWCAQGVNSTMGTFSAPNAISFVGCNIGLHSAYGMLIQHSDTFTFTGGSIESCGLSSVGNNGYGIQLFQPGDNGAVGATFVGTHFENNSNIADILINTSPTATQICAVSAIGCSFSRPTPGKFVNNNIQCNSSAGNGPVRLSVIGCGFRGFNGYTPSSLRPYILMQLGGGLGSLCEFANSYADSVEAPQPSNFAGPIVSRRAMSSAWVNFGWNGSSIVISDSNNVGSISRTSAGIYVITFSTAMATSGYVTFVESVSSGFNWATSPGTSTVTVNTTNSAGTAVDPANVYAVCFGGTAN